MSRTVKKSKPISGPRLLNSYRVVKALGRAHENDDRDGIAAVFERVFRRLRCTAADRKRFETQLIVGALAFLDDRHLQWLAESADACINSLHGEAHNEAALVKVYAALAAEVVKRG